MKKSLMIATLLIVSCVGSAANAALLGLNNTGGSNWFVNGNPATVVTTPNANWYQTGADPTKWISIQSDTNTGAPAAPGSYIFRQSFVGPANLGSGAALNLQFQFLNDNTVEVDLNGTSLGPVFSSNFGTPVFAPNVLSVTNASLLNFGASNTLTFKVTNLPDLGINPVGLWVNFTQQDYSLVVPEPASMSLWAGVCGLGFVVRRFRRSGKK